MMSDTHADFIKRQRRYENKYKGKFRRHFNRINATAAQMYLESQGSVKAEDFPLYTEELENTLKSLYFECTLTAARMERRAEKSQGVKDVIEDIINILRPEGNEGYIVNVWRNLLNQYVTARILDRINEINATTVKRLAALIQRGLQSGEGPAYTARLIRDDIGYNKNRSLAVARTETTRSLNQGRYMAALTSPYVKEKKWISTNDARTRPSHRDLGRYGKWIPLQNDFFLTSNRGLEPALYPCDNRLSAENAVNCRCTLIYRTVRDQYGEPLKKEINAELLTKYK